MKIMGLDLSTKAGLSVVQYKGDRVITYTEQINFPKLKGWPRVNAIAGRVMDLYAEHKPQAIIIEDYAVGSFGGASITSIEIGSIIRFLCWQDHIPFMDVSPTSLKKFITGKGNAKKENMILEVYKQWGFTSPTNDIADAVGLGMFGLCAYGAPSTKESIKCVRDALKSKPDQLALVRA